MTRTPSWSPISRSGSVYTRIPSTDLTAFSANDATLLVRPETVR